MQVTKENKNGVLTVTITGHLDTNTAPGLEAEVTSALEGVTELRFDLTGLIYISSAGLRVLLTLHKTMAKAGGTFLILHPCDEVMEILDMTGFASFLNIEK